MSRLQLVIAPLGEGRDSFLMELLDSQRVGEVRGLIAARLAVPAESVKLVYGATSRHCARPFARAARAASRASRRGVRGAHRD